VMLAASLILVIFYIPVHHATAPDAGDGLLVIPIENRGYAPMLKNLIDNATSTIYVAMNELSIYSPVKTLLDALISAHGRGVTVHVIYEGSYSSNSEAANYLKNAGIAVENDSWVFLHAKLVVIDGKIVYVGSHNWSPYALKYNNEYGIIIFNSTMGKFFDEYFMSLWNNVNQTPLLNNIEVQSSGMEIKTTYDGYTYNTLNDLINSATTRLYVGIYTMAYYSTPIGDERLADNLVNDIVNKKSIAKVILDNHDSGNAYNYLNNSGVNVEYDSSTNITHLKLVIADNSVYIGDSNWDYTYMDNSTHTVGIVISNSSVANFFAGYFNTIFKYRNAPYYIPDCFLKTYKVDIPQNSEKTINFWIANGGSKTNTTIHVTVKSAINATMPEEFTWTRKNMYDWRNTSLKLHPSTPGNYVVAVTFYSKYYHINYTTYIYVTVTSSVPEFSTWTLFTPIFIIITIEYFKRHNSPCKRKSSRK